MRSGLRAWTGLLLMAALAVSWMIVRFELYPWNRQGDLIEYSDIVVLLWFVAALAAITIMALYLIRMKKKIKAVKQLRVYAE